MSAREVFTQTPAWEIDALVSQWNDEQREARKAQQARRRG